MDKLGYLIMYEICPDFIFETFKGTNSISERVKPNDKTKLTIKEFDQLQEFDNIIKRARADFRNYEEKDRDQILQKMKNFFGKL